MTVPGARVPRGRLVLSGYGLSVFVLTGVYLAHPAGVLLLTGVLPIAAVLVSFRINRIADRLPWLLVIVGLSLLTIVNAKWFLLVELLGTAPTADDAVTRVLQMAGYAGVLGASVVVVLRHAPQDAGGVIDAALIGAGLAAPVWEFLARPRLVDAGATTLTQSTVLVQLLILLAALGALLRISRTAEKAKPALTYFFTSLAATVLGVVLSVILTDPVTFRQSPVVTICWLVGYLSLAAAALHPSSAAFTEPSNWRRDELSPVRLTQLGAVLVLIPLVGGVPQLFGHPPDGLLLSLGPLLTVPLVLTRFGQLMGQRTRDQRNLAYQASHDELTGLPNRRELFALATAGSDRLRAGELDTLAVLYCDLDGFKPINDRIGHDAGDHVLRVVGERLTASLRGGDTVGRLGGDEFLILCPDADPAAAEELRQRIEHAVAAPIPWRGAEVRVGVTVGLAASGARTDVSADDLVAAADQDMYARKRQRRSAGSAGSAVPLAAA